MQLLSRASRLLVSFAGEHHRDSASGPGWTEVYIDQAKASCTRSTADAVVAGYSLLLLHGLANPAECELLCTEASAYASLQSRQTSQALVRLPIVQMLSADAQALCDQVLIRGISRLREQLPRLLPVLFGDRGGIGAELWSGTPNDGPAVDASTAAPPPTITRDPLLRFVPGEPACNVYSAGGQFKLHEDQQALTVLVVLSCQDAFKGGGTAFWSSEDRPPPISPGVLVRTAAGPPTLVVKPPQGTAIIFGGDVTHAGQPVLDGERTVFVASFSTKVTKPPEEAYSFQYRSRWSVP
jgi:hypothetical protein